MLGLALGMLLAGPLAGQGRDSLTVFAAADLALAFDELLPAFQRSTGVVVVPVFGGSGNLAAQIEHGAPADLLLSANTQFVDRLVAAGVALPASRRLYAQGRLALAWPRGKAPLRNLAGLLLPGVRRVAIANPETAPYGLAAREALQTLGLWNALQAKLVIGENVRQAVQYVQAGAADAAIVAQSLVGVPDVASIPVDPALHAPIDQAAAIMTRSPRHRLAASFLAFLTGEGWPVMARNGFARPGGT